MGKIPWRRKWQPNPIFLPREFHGQTSLEGYSPQCYKQLTRLRTYAQGLIHRENIPLFKRIIKAKNHATLSNTGLLAPFYISFFFTSPYTNRISILSSFHLESEGLYFLSKANLLPVNTKVHTIPRHLSDSY